MYSLIVTVLGFVIFIYMFDVLRKRSSARTKRMGLIAWLSIGILLAIYAIAEIVTRGSGVGFFILLAMTLLFWILPASALLYLNKKNE